MITWFAATGPHISVKADEIFSVAGVSITNSHLLGILGLIVLVWALIATKRAAMGRTRHNFITKLFLWAFEGLYATVGQVIPDAKWARRVAPLSITIFFFVVAQYWMGLLPFVGPITVGEHHTPLFRGGVADLNMTFALAGVTIVAAQIYAFKYLGFHGNMGRYFISPLKIFHQLLFSRSIYLSCLSVVSKRTYSLCFRQCLFRWDYSIMAMMRKNLRIQVRIRAVVKSRRLYTNEY